jgi:hypothetical protein
MFWLLSEGHVYSIAASAGHELLLPLTSSLYVRGSLEDTENVLVNVGTGYYVEVINRLLVMSVQQAITKCCGTFRGDLMETLWPCQEPSAYF